MEMSTVVQNEDGDYDIDVAVVFSNDTLGDKGAQACPLSRRTETYSPRADVVA